MKKVAIFDIDGTVFRSSLLIELTDAMIQEGVFKPRVGKIYARAYRRWADRKDHYDKYVAAVVKAFDTNIKGVKYEKFLPVVEKVAAFHKNRVYRFTRDLIVELKAKNYFLLAISHSPKEIVQAFCKNLKFDKVYGRICEVDKHGKFTGQVLHRDLIFDKSVILKRVIQKERLTLRGSYGVGDTDSDIPFLKMVDHPICFNSNSRLYKYAKRRGWTLAVERKDVVYKM